MTYASLFTGGGLADVYAKDPLWGVELSGLIAKSAAINSNHPVYVSSILDVDPSKLEAPDTLWMSPPCTRASVANRLSGESELDIQLAQKCCEFIRVLKPSSVVLENVTGYAKFKAWQLIQGCLYEEGFWVNAQVFDMSNYGVPQSRKRFIARATKGFTADLMPEPSKGWWNAVSDLVDTFESSELTPWQSKRVSVTPKQFDLLWGDTNTIRNATIRSKDEPAPTLTANYRPGRMPLVYIGSSWHKLSLRAIARLMTVPDSYKLPFEFEDTPANRALTMKILGNGVPSLFAKGVIESLH
jgi:DNA (cytosine-5)-methyltransferase 1